MNDIRATFKVLKTLKVQNNEDSIAAVLSALAKHSLLFFEDGTPCDRFSTLPQLSLMDADVF